MKKFFIILVMAFTILEAYSQNCPSRFDILPVHVTGKSHKYRLNLALNNNSEYLNGFIFEVSKPSSARWAIIDKVQNTYFTAEGYGKNILANWEDHSDEEREQELYQHCFIQSRAQDNNLLAVEILNTPVSINVDSVVIMRRSTYCPSTVTKFLVTNEALTITEFKKRNRGLTFDIDISSDLIDSFNYEMYKQITISNEYFNQIKYNLFNDLNALYILETDSVVVSCNYDKLGKYSFCFPLTSENMPKDWKTSQKLSVEVYKNGNIEIKSIDSNGNFSSDNSELVSKYSYYDNNYLDCRIKYSTYFVDLYRLIDHMISDLNNND